MAQSGIVSQVGMCIENTFRTPPLTVISGSNNAIGIAATNPHRFFTVEPGTAFTGDPVIANPSNELDGDSQLTRQILTGKDYNGNLDFKVDGENLYYALLALFGRDIQTTLNSFGSNGSPAVMQHDFLPAKAYVPSLTVEEQFGDGNYGRVSAGSVFSALEIDCSDILMAKMTGTPHRQVPNTYPNAANALTDYVFTSTPSVIPSQMGGDGTKQWARTANPTFVDVAQGNNGSGPFVFGGMTFGTVGGLFASAFITIDGVPYSGIELLSGLKFSFTRAITSQMIGGSGLDKGAVTPGAFGVGGNISFNFKDDQIQRAGLRFSDVGLNLRFQGVKIGNTSQYYALEIHIPTFKLNKVPVIPQDGPIIISTDFTARRSPSLGYAARVRLINTFDNTSMGGVAGTTGAAGGCGGWNPN